MTRMPRENSQSASQTKSQRSQRSQNTHTQPEGTGSQEGTFLDEAAIEERVNDCARYILLKAHHHFPFRKADLQKNIIGPTGRHFETIISKVTKILKDVYGLSLIPCEVTAANKLYIVSNDLLAQYTEEDNETPLPKDYNRILLLLILSHIFMSGTDVGEASLYSFLQQLSIESEHADPTFGNVKKYVVTLVKQKYLKAITNPVTKRVSYEWGSRAEHEISKMAVLKFVSKMYPNCKPSSWTSQFEVAQRQLPTNRTSINPEDVEHTNDEGNNEANRMDVEDEDGSD